MSCDVKVTSARIGPTRACALTVPLTSVACHVRRRCAFHEVFPVGNAIGRHFEVYPRLHDIDARDFDIARKERRQCKFAVHLLHAHKRRRFGTRCVGNGDTPERQPGRRQDAEPDVPLDGDIMPGDARRLSFELRPEVLPVHEAGTDKQRNQQHDKRAGNISEYLVQGRAPAPAESLATHALRRFSFSPAGHPGRLNFRNSPSKLKLGPVTRMDACSTGYIGKTMSEKHPNVVNFSSARKLARAAKQRDERKARKEQAEANRIRFGRNGVEKKAAREKLKKAERSLDEKKLDHPAPLPDSPDKPD
jgi:hypothetical protein